MRRSRIAIGILVALSGVGLLMWGYTPASTQPLTSVVPSPTPCPSATPELFSVDPVTSPTGLRDQVVAVRIGNGEAVTVSIPESGTFTRTGSFNAYNAPAFVTVALITNTTHHILVEARVKTIQSGGCQYGGYTLWTDRDKFGAPLIIVQAPMTFLPAVFKGSPPP